MTYVELIVVLSIFSVTTSIVLFNYGGFQAKVDIKVLANDIALKIVEAQKSAVAGVWNAAALPTWKPSYGVNFDSSPGNNQKFIYFADLNNNSLYEDVGCAGECLSQINITKYNSVSELAVFGGGCPATVTNLNIVFKRPDSGAIITSSPALACSVSYVQITITSPKSVSAKLKIYPSGRIQIN